MNEINDYLEQCGLSDTTSIKENAVAHMLYFCDSQNTRQEMFV